MLPEPSPRDPRPPLRLFQPPSPAATHWINNPVLAPPAIPAANPLLQRELFERVAESHKSGPAALSTAEMRRAREQLTIPEAYRQHMLPWREQQRNAGKLAQGTLSREKYVVGSFEEFDLSAGRPREWPSGVPWVGLPCGYVQGGYLDAWLAHYSQRPSISQGSLPSAWYHLRTVLNHFRRLGILESVPKPQPFAAVSVDPTSSLFDEDLATIYTEEQLNLLYVALRDHPELQCALVLGVNCGARAGDLFQMRWEIHLRLDDPAMIRWEAEKTGKRHRIPLSPVTVAHLRRLQRSRFFAEGLVFRSLAAAKETHKDPENSAASRRRTKLFKRLAAAAGVPVHKKPWQVARATCCSRLNSVKPGVGSWIIGQGGERAATKLAATFYDNPTEDVVATLQRATWPSEWLRILE